MTYPREFSLEAHARVEAEQIRAHQELVQRQGEEPPAGWTTRRSDFMALYEYILRVFVAFTREACDLGNQRTWRVDRVRSEAEGFLRRFISQAYSEDGRDRFGKQFPEGLRVQSFRKTPKWHEFESQLLAVAERQSGIEVGPSLNNTGSRRAMVDAFILKCKQETSRNVTRGHIWRLAGHQGPRQFQFWQASDPKATTQDDQNFRRILAMTPHAFVDALKKKSLI